MAQEYPLASVDADSRDLAIHSAIEHLAEQIAHANGFTHREVLERFLAFVENDDEGESVMAMWFKNLARAA